MTQYISLFNNNYHDTIKISLFKDNLQCHALTITTQITSLFVLFDLPM